MRIVPMRVDCALAVSTMAFGLAACMSPPLEETRPIGGALVQSREMPPGDLTPGARLSVTSKLGSATLRAGDFHCAEQTHPKRALYPDCNSLPVVVLLKPKGGCLSLIPYVNLYIHSERKRTHVVWEIIGPKGYQFAEGNGIALTTSDGSDPGMTYDSKKHMGRHFKWELRDSAVFPATIYHVANVVDEQGVPCEPIDPGMINVVN